MRAAGSTVRRRGMTLIEVMIALLLLSFGLLGMIGLKLIGLSAVAKSNYRSLAAVHASEMLDRMRANATRASTGEYNISLSAPTPSTASTIAQLDVQEWRRGLAISLPSGTGSVAIGSTGDTSITVQWRELLGDSGTPQTLTYTVKGRL